MSKTTCPVFRPTNEEFRDFKKYIQFIESSNQEYGIVKVIPPQGWFTRDYEKVINDSNYIIHTPVTQIVSGRNGMYSLTLMEKNDISIVDFREHCRNNSYESDNYENVERKFWKSIGNSCGLCDPMYGADMVGSLFEGEMFTPWNVNDLDNPLKLMSKDLPGISNAMLYFGSWRAMFAFHTEDMDLYSINYLHYGSPKSWYSIPKKHKKRFESLAEAYYTEEYRNCHEFLRHKTKMVSPYKLKEQGIEFCTAVQNIGEFIITFPSAYHAGFNHGFNIAEATNFATIKWLEEVSRKVSYCVCRPNSVQIDIDYLETLIEREKIQNRNIKNSTIHSQYLLTNDTSVHVFNEESLDSMEENVNKNDPIDSWLLRCSCGKRVVYDSNNGPSVAEGFIFQCCECGAWCHAKCVYGDDVVESNEYHSQIDTPVLNVLPLFALCHICQNINADGLNDVEIVYDSKASNDKTNTQIPTSQDVKAENTKKRKKNVKFLKIGDLIQYDDKSGGDYLFGNVVDIEDGFFRFHLKGSRKDYDQWIAIDDDDSYNVIVDDDSAVIESQKQKKTERKTDRSKTKSLTQKVAPKKTGKKKEMKSHIEDQEDSAHSNLQLTEVLREGESALDYRQFNPSWCPAEWGVFLKHCLPRNFLSESDTCFEHTSVPETAIIKYWQYCAIYDTGMNMKSSITSDNFISSENTEIILKMFSNNINKYAAQLPGDLGHTFLTKSCMNDDSSVMTASDIWSKFVKIEYRLKIVFIPLWERYMAESQGSEMDVSLCRKILLNMRMDLWKIRESERISRLKNYFLT